MEKSKESKTTDVVKKKKKLTKIQITKIIMAGISAICLTFAIIFTFIKSPIDNSIYYTNTSLEEREEVWEKKQSELYNYYDKLYSPSDFSNKISTSRFMKLLYQITEVTNTQPIGNEKQLSVKIYNYKEDNITILGAIYLEHKDDALSYIRIDESEDEVFTTKECVEYILFVDADFNIENYTVSAKGVDDDNDGHSDWTIYPITSYDHELERTKAFSIFDQIEGIIGERPTNENESKEPIPQYMVEIMDAKLRYILLYVFSAMFLVLAIVIHKPKKHYHIPFATIIEPAPEPKTEVIIKEIHHAPKVTKVTCLHCGSRYKDNLDECPNCGSAKIENKTNE